MKEYNDKKEWDIQFHKKKFSEVRMSANMSMKGHVLGSAVTSATSTNLVTGGQPGASQPGSSGGAACQEFSVRVPKVDKPMSVMRFNGALNVDLAKWATLKMIRDDHSNVRKPVDHSQFEQAEMPKFGAGSEYGREAREEARRRKYGQHKKKINADDHPWVLKATTSDKQAKRFKGLREGTISSNASYFVFTQATDGQFEVFPVSQWYNFTPVQTYKALSAEEAEEEFGRRDKIMNYFSVMVRKRMKGDEAEGADKDEEKTSKKKGRGGGGGGLKVSEMEDWDDVNEMESDDDDEEEVTKDKKKKKAPNSKKKKKKGSDSEANEDSDDGDGEGRELDYISDSSMSASDEEEGGGNKQDLQGVDQETGLRNLLESDSSDEEQKEEKPEEEAEDAEKNNKGKTTKKTKKLKKKSNEAQPAVENLSDGDSDSDDSDDVNHETVDVAKSSPAATVEKEKTPEVEGDAESRKRKLAPGSSPAAKKNKLEVSSVLLQTAASEGITEEAIRRYLLRKPMTVTGLLQKFKSKKNSMSSEDMVTIIASILKKINPTKRNQNNKMYLFLKA